MGRCETCRHAKPDGAELHCSRISDALHVPVPASPAVMRTYLSTGMRVQLVVLPSFGCVLWEEP